MVGVMARFMARKPRDDLLRASSQEKDAARSHLIKTIIKYRRRYFDRGSDAGNALPWATKKDAAEANAKELEFVESAVLAEPPASLPGSEKKSRLLSGNARAIFKIALAFAFTTATDFAMGIDRSSNSQFIHGHLSDFQKAAAASLIPAMLIDAVGNAWPSLVPDFLKRHANAVGAIFGFCTGSITEFLQMAKTSGGGTFDSFDFAAFASGAAFAFLILRSIDSFTGALKKKRADSPAHLSG